MEKTLDVWMMNRQVKATAPNDVAGTKHLAYDVEIGKSGMFPDADDGHLCILFGSSRALSQWKCCSAIDEIVCKAVSAW